MTKVVVVGGGPAGMAAACRAAEAGASVLLLVEDRRLGGQIWRGGREAVIPEGVRHWNKRLEQTNVEVCFGVTVVDIVDSTVLLHHDDGGATSIRYDKLILACGAQELFIPFPGWTLPNIIGVGGAQALLKAGWSFEGKRVVVTGSGPLLFAVAGNLAKAGAKIVCIAEQAGFGSLMRFALGTFRYQAGKILEGIGYGWHYFPAPYMTGTWITEAKGDDMVREVVLNSGKVKECDIVACAYGLVPSADLAILAGCEQENNHTVVNWLQESSVSGILCAGEITGVGGVDQAVTEGEIAGLVAAGDVRAAERLTHRRKKQDKFANLMNRCFTLRNELRDLPDDNTIVCRCEDVTFSQLKKQPEQRSAKMFTRAGMGSCQGRVCSCAMKFLLGWETNSVRPPVFPVPMENLVTEEV